MSEEQPGGAVVDAEEELVVEPNMIAEPSADAPEGEPLGAPLSGSAVTVPSKGSDATPDEKKVPST